MVGIIAKKVGMTSIFEEKKLVPCTIVATQSCVVTQIKTREKNGYEAIQIACQEQREKNASKPLRGHCSKANTTPKKKFVEFRDFAQDYTTPLKLGDTLKAESIFEEEEYIDVVGTSKGKGFCGVVKRHGFKGAKEATHGQKHTLRAPGSIGNVEEPVRKGKKMAGRAGNQRVKTKNLEVIKIIPDKNIIVLKGSVPGANKNYLILQK